MALASLTFEEREVIRRTMAATFQYFDSDFQTRLGVTQDEMRALLAIWPAIDDADDVSLACIAINNSLNDLLNGEGIRESEALELIGVTSIEMRRIHKKWTTARGWTATGVR